MNTYMFYVWLTDGQYFFIEKKCVRLHRWIKGNDIAEALNAKVECWDNGEMLYSIDKRGI